MNTGDDKSLSWVWGMDRNDLSFLDFFLDFFWIFTCVNKAYFVHLYAFIRIYHGCEGGIEKSIMSRGTKKREYLVHYRFFSSDLKSFLNVIYLRFDNLTIPRGFIKRREAGIFPFYSGMFPLLLLINLYRVYKQILSNHPPTLPWYPDAKKVNEIPAFHAIRIVLC